jgi:hypothetical protein
MKRLFVSLFLKAHAAAPERIILDLDATDDPIHGGQEGRFFHGYYKCYCYLPLYIFCGRELLLAKLRPANIDAPAGAKEETASIIAQSGSAGQALKSGSGRIPASAGRNSWLGVRLTASTTSSALPATQGSKPRSRTIWPRQRPKPRKAATPNASSRNCATKPTRAGPENAGSWRRQAEHLLKGSNPRFIVTSLTSEAAEAQELYEKIYCARGDMENRYSDPK